MKYIEQTIEDLQKEIKQKQKELEGLQLTVNNLCKRIDRDPIYDLSIYGKDEILQKTLKGDEYFRKPTATAITLILKSRKIRNIGPATINEIYEKMIEGGYIFNVKDPIISIGTALGKNPKFTKVGEKWGLTEWYPTETQKDKGTSKKLGRPKKVKQDEPKE